MPSAERVLYESGLPVSAATGSGPGGRVLKEDAMKAVAAAKPSPEAAPVTIATLFSIVVLLSLKDFIGWPSKSGLPQEFQLHWAIINEPDKIKNTEGAIYMWITELDNKNKNNGLPRAYKIDYTRKNHEEIMKGLINLGDGIQQKGEKVKAKEDIDIEEDLSNLQEIVIYELPKPLLPDKNDSRTEQGLSLIHI